MKLFKKKKNRRKKPAIEIGVSLKNGELKLRKCEDCPNTAPERQKLLNQQRQELYNQTMFRLARQNVRTHTSQIIALAEEIEYYRGRILHLEEAIERAEREV